MSSSNAKYSDDSKTGSQQLVPRAANSKVSNGYIFILWCVNCLGGGVFGYNLGVVSGTLEFLKASFGIEHNPLLVGMVAGVFLAGAMVGSLFGGGLCDRFGRKGGVALYSSLILLFSIFSALSPRYWILMVCRFVVGVGVGLACVVSPLYVDEMAPEKWKNILGSTFQLSVTGTLAVAYMIAFFLPTTNEPNFNWRIQYALGTIQPVLALIVAFVMPESTVWFRMSRSLNGPSSSSSINQDDYNSALIGMGRHTSGDIRGGWTGLFSRVHRHSLLIGIFLGVVAALTGINAVLLYAPQIFAKIPAIAKYKEIMTLLLFVSNFVNTIFAIGIVKCFGRKTVLIGGIMLMCVGLGGLALADAIFSELTAGYVSLVCIFLFVFGYSVGPGVVFWLMVSSTFHESVRSQGTSLINLQQWTENLLLTAFFPTIRAAVPIAAIFAFFFVVSVICAIALFILIKPEEEIEWQEDEGDWLD